MIDVGVRQLKAHLSEYLERAASGEVVRVTERGKPKAILGPLPGTLRLQEGIAEGWVRPPVSVRGVRGPWRRFAASRSVAEMVAEDRGA